MPNLSRHLLAPTVGTGALMAAYLLLRPYGDASGDPTEAARAFASPAWVVAHACGALAIASFGRLALRVSDLVPGPLAAAGRWAGLAGTVLVLPYYGAETFGLHAIGARVLAGDEGAFALVEMVRNQPVALTSFGIGLVLLAASGLLTAGAWQRVHAGTRASALWPLGIGIAALLPQFSLPPAGRVAFGLAYGLAAAWFMVEAVRGDARGDRASAAAAEGVLSR